MLNFQSKCAICWIFSQNLCLCLRLASSGNPAVRAEKKFFGVYFVWNKSTVWFEVGEQSKSAREGGKKFFECILFEISQRFGSSCNLCLCLRLASSPNPPVRAEKKFWGVFCWNLVNGLVWVAICVCVWGWRAVPIQKFCGVYFVGNKSNSFLTHKKKKTVKKKVISENTFEAQSLKMIKYVPTK